MEARVSSPEPSAMRRVIVLALLVPFVAVAQLWLSSSAMMGPDRGELGWPLGAVIALLTIASLVWATDPRAASEPDARRRLRIVAPVMVALWLCAIGMALLATLSTPWTLVSVPMWLGPSEARFLLRPALWLPFHLLHAAGPVCLALAISTSERRARSLFILGGVLPWVLATVGYAIANTITAPTFLG